MENKYLRRDPVNEELHNEAVQIEEVIAEEVLSNQEEVKEVHMSIVVPENYY